MCLVFILMGPGKYCNLSVDSIRWQYEVLMGSCVIDVVFEVVLAGTWPPLFVFIERTSCQRSSDVVETGSKIFIKCL